MKCLSIMLFTFAFLISNNSFAQVQVDSVDISAIFYGPFNKTTIEFYLYNPTKNDSIGGTIEFEINKTSFVENLYLEINDNLKKAHTLNRYQGEIIYNLIIRKRIDPALLIKLTENKYQLNVFPFRMNQKRKVVIEYYSVLESDTSKLPYWHFDIKTFSKKIKGQLHITSEQEENVKIYKLNKQTLEKIATQNSPNKVNHINNLTFKDESQYKIYFDFNNLKLTPVYYFNSLRFYQTKPSLKLPQIYQSSKCTMFVSTKNDYVPDFMANLLNKIKNNEKPTVFAFSRDNYLNNFLRYLSDKNEIFLNLDENFISEFQNNIKDDYHWLLKNRHWYYVDHQFTLIQKDYNKIYKPLKIECPFLNKFIDYLTALQKDIDYQITRGYLNSNLAKIVIEKDQRALQIWKNETGKEYKPEDNYFVAIEEMPEPIGGVNAIQNSVFFPVSLLKGAHGFKVYMLALVDKTGHTVNIKTIKGPNLSSSLNYLVEKISKFAVCKPNWKPGRQRGTPVEVQVSIPIVFKAETLSETKSILIGNREFIASVGDTTECFLIEKGFRENESIPIKFSSDQFYKLIIENPDMIDLFYRAMYLSNFDGIGFNSFYGDKIRHYFITQSL